MGAGAGTGQKKGFGSNQKERLRAAPATLDKKNVPVLHFQRQNKLNQFCAFNLKTKDYQLNFILKGTVSQEKLLNCGLGEMDRTLTINRT